MGSGLLSVVGASNTNETEPGTDGEAFWCEGVRSKVSATENQSLNDRAPNSRSLELGRGPGHHTGSYVSRLLLGLEAPGRGLARGRELPMTAVGLLVGRAQPMALLSTPGPMQEVGF